MMALPHYPSQYQINTRVWLMELSRTLGRRATLDDIPDAELDCLAEWGFDWVWFLSVWQTGLAGQRVSRTNPEWRRESEETLSDLSDEDTPGSGFAITGNTVHENLGGDEALARLRERLRQRGLKLLLDFVPNHMGLDHPWTEDHPEYFIAGTELDLAAPQNYTWVKREGGDLLLAYGRDPYFPGWPDTLQLDYANPALRQPAVRDGQWQLLECVPAWEGNGTSDCFVAFAWRGSQGERILAVVNYAANQSQCRVRLPFAELADGQWRITDQLGSDIFDRDGHALTSAGLYLDMRPWQAAVYTLNWITP